MSPRHQQAILHIAQKPDRQLTEGKEVDTPEAENDSKNKELESPKAETEVRQRDRQRNRSKLIAGPDGTMFCTAQNDR